MFGPPPQNPHHMFWHGAFQTSAHCGPEKVFKYPKNTFSGPQCAEVCVFGAPSQNPPDFFGMMRFKHPHPRYRNTPFLAHGVQRCGGLGRHPTTHTIFLASCVSNASIVGIQKVLYWSMVCKGMGDWRANPQPTQFFWHGAFQTPTS